VDLSIIIPSYESEETIGLCLKSIFSQEVKADYEVIVVDSTPNDGVGVIVSKYPGARLIKLPLRGASGSSRRTGWEKSSGEIAVFLDSDVYVPEGWLQGVLEYYRSGHDVFGVGIDMHDGAHAGVWGRLDWFFQSSEYKSAMPPGVRWCLPGAALVIKSAALRDGCFGDWERSSDTELTARLRGRGYVLHFNPALSVSHRFQTTPSKLVAKVYACGKSQMRLRLVLDVQGSYIVRRPPLLLVSIPAFAIVKFARMTSRNLRWGEPKDKLWYIALSPLMALILLFWMGGAYSFLLSGGRA
jgi:glycosyltransferase involved in cell wall biosynthesis